MRCTSLPSVHREVITPLKRGRRMVDLRGFEPPPSACHAGALPIELQAHGGDDGPRTRNLLRAREPLVHLSLHPHGHLSQHTASTVHRQNTGSNQASAGCSDEV